MIIVDKSDKTTINIPRNSLGNMTYNKPNADLSDYYTKEEVDELIENVEVDLTNYYTKEEIDNIVENTTIPYLVINKDWNGYESGDFESVRQAIGDKKPYFIYAPAPLGGYFSPNYAERVFGQINCHFFYHTDNGTNYYYFVYLHSDEIRKNTKTLQYATTSDLLKYGVNGLIVNYNEEFNEYTYNGVDFYTLKQAIESGNKLYSIYLPSSDNTYKIAAQEIVVNDNEIRCITIENNGDTKTTTNWTIRFDDEYFEMHITKGNSTTIKIATQEWIEEQGYLTSIPDDVVTEDELNEALENIDMSYPTLIINLANSTYEGDLDEVVAAIKNDEPVNVIMRKNNNTIYLATQYYVTSTYFRCYCRYWLSVGRLEETYVQITFATNEVKKTTRETIGVVDNLASSDATSALSANQGRVLNETKQETLVSGENIKTINGESILGEGNIEIGGSEGGSDIPYVVIEYKNTMTLEVISGDLQTTLIAAKNKQPFLAYFYNTYNSYGMAKTLYPFTYVYVGNDGAVLRYHTEMGAIHKDISITCEYDTETQEYTLETLGTQQHNYLSSIPSEYVTETELETTLTNKDYATTTYVSNQIGNINTILENIIG